MARPSEDRGGDAPEGAAYMARAIRLAEQGLYTTDPNPRVGCVLVRNGMIVGEGWHRRVGGPHAEIEALRSAGARAAGATAYVTLEPCCHHGRTPPCTEALIRAGVSRVVAAMEDPNPRVGGKGFAALRLEGVETSSGLLRQDAEALNPGFCKRMKTGLPYIRSKLAMSLDGRTALASGESRWITGEAARRDVHRLRARSSAILTGVATVLADDPQLTARPDDSCEVHQPIRVVLDSGLRIPPSAKVLRESGRVWVATVAAEPPHTALPGAEICPLPPDREGRVDLAALAELLGRRECNEILVEAGPVLNGALLKANLVDEWVIYMAPCVLGDDARGLFHGLGLTRLAERYELGFRDVRQVGRDLRVTLVKAG